MMDTFEQTGGNGVRRRGSAPWKRVVRFGLLLVGVGLGTVPAVRAQTAPPMPAVEVVSTRSPWLDAALFVGLSAGAIYAVVRGSRRV